jgi:enoyl-CoA hydratase
MRTKSPTSLKIAREQMRQGRTLSFEDCMHTEFRIVSRIVYGSEFYEGIRAAIIDKDNKPAWCPAALEEVTDADIARYFAPLGSGELDLR